MVGGGALSVNVHACFHHGWTEGGPTRGRGDGGVDTGKAHVRVAPRAAELGRLRGFGVGGGRPGRLGVFHLSRVQTGFYVPRTFVTAGRFLITRPLQSGPSTAHPLQFEWFATSGSAPGRRTWAAFGVLALALALAGGDPDVAEKKALCRTFRAVFLSRPKPVRKVLFHVVLVEI